MTIGVIQSEVSLVSWELNIKKIHKIDRSPIKDYIHSIYWYLDFMVLIKE